jgi:hypothetical protein
MERKFKNPPVGRGIALLALVFFCAFVPWWLI